MTDTTIIFIDGNKQLAEFASYGQGTSDNPYVIDGIEILHTTAMDNTKLPTVSLYIMNTDKYTVIKNCKFIGLPKHFAPTHYIALHILNCNNLMIIDNVFYGFRVQISTTDIDNVIIANNVFVNAETSVECAFTKNRLHNRHIHVVYNAIYNTTHGILIGKTKYVNVSHNLLTGPDVYVSDNSNAISMMACQNIIVANNIVLCKFATDLLFGNCQNLIIFNNILGPNVEKATALLNYCYMTSVLNNLFVGCKGIVDMDGVVNLDFLLNFGAHNVEGLKLPDFLLGFSKFCDNVFV